MANKENLVRLTTEKARIIGRAGGIASGKVKREKKLMKEQMKMLLSLPLKNDKLKQQIESFGIDTKDIDNQLALVVSVYQQALKGNMKAVELLRDTMGEKPQDNLNVECTNNPFSGLTTDELKKMINE